MFVANRPRILGNAVIVQRHSSGARVDPFPARFIPVSALVAPLPHASEDLREQRSDGDGGSAAFNHEDASA